MNHFYESFKTRSTTADNGRFKLSISYKDPATLEPRSEEIEMSVVDLLGRQERNIRSAETIFLFNQLMAKKISAHEVNTILGNYPAGFSTPLYTEYTELIHRYESLAP